MGEMKDIDELLNNEICINMPSFFNRLHSIFSKKKATHSLRSDLIDQDLIVEIENAPENVSVFFGKNLRDLKLCITDESLREHEIFLKYKNRHKLTVSSVNIPNSSLQDTEYSCIDEVVTAFRSYINRLAPYFQELENIDHHCVVMEPVKPTFKDDFRNILIDNRTWLHIEVTSDGLARNIHLVGHKQSEQKQDKLRTGLLYWDHDKDIVQNINSIFNLLGDDTLSKETASLENNDEDRNVLPMCGICFCVELPECPGLPQPLCQNTNCEVYFHRKCIFQWLVACEGGRPTPFGVVNGTCPTCLQPMTCSERDN